MVKLPVALTQYAALLVKAVQLKAREPLRAVVEVLVPTVFTLLLAIGYWLAENPSSSSESYADGIVIRMDDIVAANPGHVVVNILGHNVSLPEYFFCQRRIDGLKPDSIFPRCPPLHEDDVDSLGCLSTNMRDICYNKTWQLEMSAMVLGFPHLLPSAVIPYSMSSVLALNRWVYDTNPSWDHFGQHNPRESLFHTGYLMVVGNHERTSGFRQFCAAESELCGRVLYPHKVTSMDWAQQYTYEHGATVWAVLDLSDFDPANGHMHFTIRMNFTATGFTFDIVKPYMHGRGPRYELEYMNSGFLTLQTMVSRYGMAQLAAAGAGDGRTGPLGAPENIALCAMPTRGFATNNFLYKSGHFVPLVMTFGFLYALSRLLSGVVDEKETRTKEAMLIMGLRPSAFYTSWLTVAFFLNLIACLAAALAGVKTFFNAVDYSVLFVTHFCFANTISAMGFILSAVFSRARVAALVGPLLLFITTVPHYAIPPHTSVKILYAVSILPCTAYAQAINTFTEYATNGVQFTWSDVSTGEYSVATALLLMLLDLVLYLLIALYLDLVMPGETGRPLHPLFFLPKSLRCTFRNMDKDRAARPVPPTPVIETDTSAAATGGAGGETAGGPHSPASDDDRSLATIQQSPVVPSAEATDDDASAAGAVQLRGLCKRYGGSGDSYAVNGLNLDIRRDEILVLLGHNGAGKSTTMHMITGMIEPTDGNVSIFGHSINDDTLKCRSNIGFCPQHNILWPQLSVVQHLTFFAVVKAQMSRSAASEAAHHYADLVGLEPHVQARALSGGQKRKLSVAIALIGDSPFVLLDEPTAGMDANARRDMWEMLLARRAGRCLLLSTHYMDEADLLGSRIAMMDRGVLHSFGTSLFLKSMLGTGYTLTLSIRRGVAADGAVALVTSHCPLARLDTSSLPSADRRDDHQTRSAARLLTGSSAMLAATRVSSSSAMLDDADDPSTPLQQHHQRVAASAAAGGAAATGPTDDVHVWLPTAFVDDSHRARALFVALEDGGGAAVGVTSYGLALTTLEDVFVGIADHGLQPTAQGTSAEDVTVEVDAAEPLLRDPGAGLVDARDEERTFRRHLGAMMIKRLHCAKRDRKAVCFQIVLPVVFMTIALLLMLLHPPDQPALTITSHMFPSAASELLLSTHVNPEVSRVSPFFGPTYEVTPVRISADGDPSIELSNVLESELLNRSTSRWVAVAARNEGAPYISSYIATGLHNVTAMHGAPLVLSEMANAAIREAANSTRPQTRASRLAQRAELVVTNHPLPMSKYEKEMVTAIMKIVSALFVLIPFTFIPAQFVAFTVRERETKAKHLQWVSGANVAAYWVSTALADLLAFLVTEVLALTIFLIFHRTAFVGDFETFAATFFLFLFYGLAMVPASCLLSFCFDKHGSAQNTVLLGNFFFGFLLVLAAQILAAIESTREVNLWLCWVYRLIPSYALGEGIIALTGRDMSSLILNGNKPGAFSMLKFHNKYGGFIGGVGTSLTYMGCTAPIFFATLFLLERSKVAKYQLQLRLAAAASSSGDDDTANKGDESEDDDVAAERAAVEKGTGREQDCLTVQRLKKVFPSRVPPKVAVDGISFGVHRGEIFAFLGSNGAGKTTTMSVLTGDLTQSSGRAFVSGYDVSRHPEMARRCLGYCPQFDALHAEMTPTEHMYLYSRLKGLPEEAIAATSEHLLRGLGVYAYRDKPARALSGGNKRKLSIAIALVGNPSVVLLDEPSAGMDPLARRVLWRELEVMAQSRSVVLTTHHLEEVEALADRAAIMVAGRLRCIGSLQHLKTKFGGGAYELTVKTETLAQQEKLQALVESELGGVALERHGTQGQFSLAGVRLSRVFGFLAEHRQGCGVVTFGVSQATIEQVFLRISAENEAEDADENGGGGGGPNDNLGYSS